MFDRIFVSGILAACVNPLLSFLNVRGTAESWHARKKHNSDPPQTILRNIEQRTVLRHAYIHIEYIHINTGIVFLIKILVLFDICR
jgi:hypothetical protein